MVELRTVDERLAWLDIDGPVGRSRYHTHQLGYCLRGLAREAQARLDGGAGTASDALVEGLRIAGATAVKDGVTVTRAALIRALWHVASFVRATQPVAGTPAAASDASPEPAATASPADTAAPDAAPDVRALGRVVERLAPLPAPVACATCVWAGVVETVLNELRFARRDVMQSRDRI